MSSFYGAVIKYRRIIILIFCLLTAVCAVLQSKVRVDYDVLNYLPPGSPSTKAILFMEEEFGGGIPNARVVIKNADKKTALEYKRRIEALDGVISVTWVDTLVPVDMPLEFYPDSLIESYYKDGNALLVLSLDERKQLETVPEIYEIIGEDNLLAGQSVNTVVATLNTIKEVIKISVIAVFFLLLVLVLTTRSWTEPFLILIGLGVSVVINAGTNIIFDKVSFVTNSSGMILQMAISLDYSVFLVHRYEECRQSREPEEAMKEALILSNSSIVSSAVTTIIGFFALAAMRFLLGADMGFALSKGVAISMITTLVFLPGLILTASGLIERTRHRSFVPSFRGLGRVICRITLPLCIVFVAAIAPSFYASTHNSYLYGGSRLYGQDTRVGRDTAEIEKEFGQNDTYVLMVPRGRNSDEYSVVRELKDDPRIRSVLSPLSVTGEALPPELLTDSLISQLRSDRYDRIVISTRLPNESEDSFDLIEKVYAIADKYFPGEYYLAGSGISILDIKKVVTSDMVRVNLIAVAAVFLVLIVMMRNLLLPVILVLTIETAIWINMSISYMTNTPLFYIAYLIISSVQLGATVDYAILFTERYKEQRSLGSSGPRECVVSAVSDTAVPIFTSVFAVSLMGFLLGALSTQRLIAQLGMLLGRGALCSFFAVFFVLPGFLMLTDRFFIRRTEDSALSSPDR